MTLQDYMPDLQLHENTPVRIKMVRAPINVMGEHLFVDADVRIYDEQESTVSVHIIQAWDGTEDVTKALKLLDLVDKVTCHLALIWEEYIVDESVNQGGSKHV